MPYNDYFIFNGVKSTDMGVRIANDPTSEIPARRGDEIIVPGRNGVIVQEDGSFSTYTQTYDVLMDSSGKASDVYAHARQIAAWLLGSRGFCRLEDSFEPEYFRLARCAEQISIENRLMRFGRAKINFDCQPQRYLKSGETSFSFGLLNRRKTIRISPIEDGVSSIRFEVFSQPSADAVPYLELTSSTDSSKRVTVNLEAVTSGSRIDYSGEVTVLDGYDTIEANASYNVNDASLIYVFSDRSEVVQAGIASTLLFSIYNHTEFQSRPLIRFERITHQPVSQTLTHVDDTFINAYGEVKTAKIDLQKGIEYTTQPVTVEGYDYAIVTGKSYTFLNESSESVGFGFAIHETSNPNDRYNEKMIEIPLNAKTIVIGDDVESTAELSLQLSNPEDVVGELGINGILASVNFKNGDIVYLDCDLHDAYYPGGGNANAFVSFSKIYGDNEYPTFQGLDPGENLILSRNTENFEIQIIPRWWVL